MTTYAVKTPFTTPTRRFPAGAEVTSADLAGDILGLGKRVERGELEAKKPADQPPPPARRKA